MNYWSFSRILLYWKCISEKKIKKIKKPLSYQIGPSPWARPNPLRPSRLARRGPSSLRPEAESAMSGAGAAAAWGVSTLASRARTPIKAAAWVWRALLSPPSCAFASALARRHDRETEPPWQSPSSSIPASSARLHPRWAAPYALLPLLYFICYLIEAQTSQVLVIRTSRPAGRHLRRPPLFKIRSLPFVSHAGEHTIAILSISSLRFASPPNP
jgi:hypothetical protein